MNNIKLDKNAIRGILIVTIILVMFNVVVFTLPFERNSVFWVSYIFSIIAIPFQSIFFYVGKDGEKNLKSRLYKYPVIRISVIYLIAQLIFNFIMMTFSATFSLGVAVAIYVILIGLASIGLITTSAMSEKIERQDIVLERKVSNIRNLQSKARYIAKQCNATSAQQSTINLAEKFQYSDPVSSISTEALEAELDIYLDEIQAIITDEDYYCAIAFCQKAEIMLAERNRLCKLNKNK